MRSRMSAEPQTLLRRRRIRIENDSVVVDLQANRTIREVQLDADMTRLTMLHNILSRATRYKQIAMSGGMELGMAS